MTAPGRTRSMRRVPLARLLAGGLRRLPRPALKAAQPVLRQLLPHRLGPDPAVELRPDTRVVVQRPEPDRHLRAVRPRSSEQARAADAAKRLHHPPAGRAIDLDQLLSGEEPEPLT